MARGTLGRSPLEIEQALDRASAQLTPFAGRGGVGLELELPAASWEQGVRLVADSLLHPSFPDSEIEHVRRQLLEELRHTERSPLMQAQRLFVETLWQSPQAGRDPLGSAESLSRLTRQRLVAHWREQLTPSQVSLAVVGAVDAEEVARLVARLFAEGAATESSPSLAPLPRGRPRGARVRPPRLAVASVEPAGAAAPLTEPAIVVGSTTARQAALVLGFPLPRSVSLDGAQRLAALLGGPEGRLVRELRDQRSLAQSVAVVAKESSDEDEELPGTWAVVLTTSPEQVEACLAILREQLARLVEVPLSEPELARMERAHLVDDARIRSRVAWRAARLAHRGLSGPEPLRTQGATEGRTSQAPPPEPLSAEALRRVAQQLFDPSHALVALVRPEPEPPLLAKAPGEPLTPSLKRARTRGSAKHRSHSGSKKRSR
jgi:zinc protease